MPILSLSVTLPRLDREAYLRDFRQSIHDAMILAAQKFLQAAIPLIPVWTGMASGAFENLEILTGQTIPRQPPNPRASRGYYYYPDRVQRTPELGQALTTQPNEILSGDLTYAGTGTRLFFNFSVNINYFNVLDPERWGAWEAGTQAFNAELAIQLDRLRPDIGNYYVRRGLI